MLLQGVVDAAVRRIELGAAEEPSAVADTAVAVVLRGVAAADAAHGPHAGEQPGGRAAQQPRRQERQRVQVGVPRRSPQCRHAPAQCDAASAAVRATTCPARTSVPASTRARTGS